MTPRLITIGYSHFCEKARWALDRYNVPYVEEAHPPLISWVPAKRSGGKRTVPVLITEEGVLDDSDAILRYAEKTGGGPRLYLETPQHDEFLARLDAKFGPAVRRYAYFYLLQQPPAMRVLLAAYGTPFERTLAKTFSVPISAVIRKGLKIDRAGAERSLGIIEGVFSEVEALIADGRPYLFGASFSAADLAFTALGAPLFAPPSYRGQLVDEALMPYALRKFSEDVAARPVGKFAVGLYERERSVRVS